MALTKQVIPIIAVLVSSVLLSCSSNTVFDQNQEINANGWAISDTISFDFDVANESEFYNLFLNFRNDNSYPYRNIYLFVKITAPNNKYSMDTVQCLLADKEGKWMGKSAGHLWNNVIMYKEKIQFPFPGTYRIEYIQGMREEVLPSITDVGFRLEQYQEEI